MELRLDRKPTIREATFGQLFVDGSFECYTLEDAVRETDEPVEKWKIQGRTAIPAGRYAVSLEESGKFGPDTITINDVPGFSFIRIHSGTFIGHSEGCPMVGDRIDWEKMTISGGIERGVLKRLKAKIKQAIERNEPVSIQINNPVIPPVHPH